MLKIYFNKDLINDYPHIAFLSPLLGVFNHNEEFSRWKALVGEWENLGREYLSFTTIENCDYVIFPKNFSIDFMDELLLENKKAMKYGKKLVVFYYHDNEISIDDPNIVVFRTSIDKRASVNEYCCPPIIESIYSERLLKLKKCKNSIGYVGYFQKPSFLLRILNFIRVHFLFYGFLYKITVLLGVLIPDSLCTKFGINPKTKEDSFLYLIAQKGVGKQIRYKVIKDIERIGYPFLFIRRHRMFDPSIKGNYREEYINNIYSLNFR